MMLPDHQWSLRTWTWPAYRQFLLKSDWPILVGPWRSELGFEANYWLPFVEKLIADGVDRKRLIPVTRGGADIWYTDQGGVELYDLRTVQQVRVENRRQAAELGIRKQDRLTPFDAQVLKDAAKRKGLHRYHVLHPAWMYHTLAPFWAGKRGMSWLLQRTHYRQIPAGPGPEGLSLPEQFLAVRFYARDTFPMNVMITQQFVEAVVQTVAATMPVVVLESRIFADDHTDFKIGPMPNVYHLPDLYPVTPKNIFAVQSAVIGRSQGFVGTYGGFAQTVLRMGKPSVSFYLEWGGTSVHHKFLSEFLSVSMKVPFQVQRLGEIPMLRSVLPQVETVPIAQHLEIADPVPV